MPFDYNQFAAKKPQENANGVQPVDHSSNLDNIFAEAEAELQKTNNSDTQMPHIDAPHKDGYQLMQDGFREQELKLASGFNYLNRAAASIPEGITRAASVITNPVAKLFGIPEYEPNTLSKTIGLDKVDNYLVSERDKYQKEIKKINPYTELGVVNAVKEKNYEAAFRNLAGGVLESLPASVALMTLPIAGVGVPGQIGFSTALFGSGKLKELDEVAPDLPEEAKVINATVNGALEGIFETLFGSGAIGSSLDNILKKEGLKQGEKIIGNGVRQVFSDLLTKYPALSPFGEMYEEMATQVTQNITDKLTGVDPEKPVTEGMWDAGILGFTSGGLHGGMIAGTKAIANRLNKHIEKKQARANIEANLSPITNAKTGNVHAVKLRGQEKDEDEVYFVVDVDADGFANIVDRQGNKVLDSEGKPYQNIEDFTTENVISREQILQGELQSLTQEQAAKEQTEAQAEREQKELAQVPQQLTIPDENGKEQKYVFAGEVRRNNPEKPNEITDFEVGLVDEFGEMPYDIAFLPAKTVYDYIGSQNESNEKELDQVLADAEKEVSAENSDQNGQNVTTTPSEDNNLSGKPVVTQKIGNADIDVIENEDHDEIVASEKMPLEKALPLLEKKFKDNPKFEVVAEKERVEIPGRVIKGETKWDEDVVEPSTFKTVIKSVKIFPKEVLEQKRKEEQESKSFYQEQKKSILVDAVSKFNATPDSRSDKQKASEIEALATKLGYMTDRSPMNEIRIFNNKEGYVNIPKTSQPEQSGQINQLQTNENISNPDKLTTFKAEQQVNTSETTQPKATKPPTPKQIERAKLLKSEPNSAREVILKYFLSGGKVSPEMINRESIGRDRTGKLRSEGERRSMFWVTKQGEANYTDQLEHILHGTPWEKMLDDPTDFSNEVLDVLSLGTPSNMMAELKRLQSEQGSFDQQYSPEQVSEIETWAAQQAESERLDYEEQLQSVFEELFENQNISEQEIVNLFYTNNEENDNDQNEGRSGQASPENSTTTRDNPIGSIETSRGSNEGEESQTERFGLKTTKTVQDLSDNINSILKQYSGREMAAIQAEKYLNEFPELGQQYLNGNNITSRDELKSHLAKLQSKVREGKGKERQENKKQFKEQKTQQAIDEIEQMALAADAEMQKQIEESEYNETFENKEPEKSTETKQEESVNKEDNNILESESLPKNNTSVNQNVDFFTEIQQNIPTNDKIKTLEDKLTRQKKLREQKVKNMNERNGVFGDAQADPRQIDLFTETFAPTQENFQAAIDKIDDEIAGIQRELDIERKRQITAEKENAGQLNIESEQAKNKRTGKETEKEIPTSPDGKYQIYEYKVKNNDDGVDLFYGVPSWGNKGEKGFGDDLVDTLDQAIEAAEYNRHQEGVVNKRKEERELQKQQEEAAKQAKAEANKGKSKLELMNEAKNEKALNKQLNYEGNIKTRKQFIEDSVREGKTFKIGQENKIKDVTRSAYDKMNGREQEEFDKRQKEAGLKNVYKVVDTDGSYYEITKAEYDYAIKLQQQAQPVVKENLSTEPTDIFEQLQDVANKRKAEKEIVKAESEVDTNPTEAQKEAGNYKKGHVTIHGLDITIENPKGSVRSGVDKTGKTWSVTMNNTYGYFKRTVGKDGDHVDVFLGDKPLSEKVFVIDQNNEDGNFDESKVMLGFDSAEQAQSDYMKNYSPGWKGFGAITESSIDDFKEWLNDGARQNKAYSEYKQNQSVETNEKVEVKPEINSYGANNKIVTNERAEELKKRLRDKLNNLNVGFDPELLAIGTELAAYHIESGARKFADFSKKMIEDVGEAIKPYLKAIYNGARDIPGMEAYEPEMTEYSDVKKADIDQLLKPLTENNVQENKLKDNGKQRVLQGNNKRSPKTESPSLFQGIEGEQRTGRDSGLQSDKVLKTNGEQQQPTGREGTVLPRNADLLEPALVEFNADENDTKSFNPTQKYKDNIAAIETVISLIREKRAATPQEKETLSKYVGFGGLKDIVLNPELDKGWGVSNSKYKPLVKRVIELSNEFNEASGTHDSLGSITGSILNAHFTPSSVIHAVYDGLKKLGFKGGQILEPSAGIGNFVTFMPNHIKGNSTITAVELDDLTGNILKYLHDDVNVKVLGIQDANIPNNSQDLVISNVPFGNYKIFDKAFKGVKEQFQNRIHNYFFAKAVDMARDGGLIAFVTSKGVMDAPGNEQLRRYLDQNTEFLGAVRLPNSAFKNNANTEVVTDIIFLKKNSTINKSNPNFINVFKVSATHKDGEQQEVGVNQYFVDHPENILGDIVAGGLYSRDDYTVENKKEYDLSSAITKALPNNVYTPTTSGIGLQANDSQETIDAIKEGNIQLTNGRLVRKQEGQLVDISINEPTAKIDHYITLRNSLMNLIYSEYLGKSDKEVNELRYYLNRQYDTFVKKYGKLEKSAIKITKQDADGYNVLSLEVKSKQDGKADIFRQRTIQPIQNKLTAENIDEAIVISLYEHAKVDIERIAELMNLTIPEAIEKAKGKIFEEPTGGFVTRDEYLSGNVKQKLKQAQQAVENGNTEFQNNVDELQNVIPRDIPAMNIEARLGSRWIPQQVYTDFAQYLFNTPQARIIYQKSIDAYSHDGRVGTVEATNKYGTSRRNGLDILVDALLINPPKIYDTQIDKTRILNQEETAKAIEKYEEIRNKFQDWVYKSEDRRTLLSGIYNERFNTSVKRSYNGDHLNISGINGVELRKHQKDAIWMLLQNNGGIIDHLVGAGKTYVMVAGTMEMKRTGLAKKPMIMALKSTIPQIVESYRNAFPMAKILAPLEKDFTKENRNKLFAQIANNEWDVIIMSHENYGKIPHEADIQQKFIEDEMAEVEEERAELAAAGEKQALKGLEIRLKNLEARLEKIANIDKDNSLTFEQMGIDHIMVDESQQFKNLSYVTKQRGVAGLSKAEGSKRAFNLFIGIRYLQQKYGADKGTTFLSGTPISNSMVEMYLLLKYLRPGKMNELAFNSFDAWATTFASPSSDIEFTVTGDFKAKTRFREFINVPELSMLYTEIADIRTDKNTPLDKPKMKGGGYSVEEIKMSGDQIEYAKKLMEFARTKDGSHIGMTLSKNQETAAMLLATNLSSKMAIDMRMINSGFSYDPNGKIAKLTDNVTRIYNETDKYKGTQLIFSDLGTPKNKTNKAALLRDYMEDELGVNLDTLNEIFGDTNEQTHRYPSVTVIKNRLSEVLEMTEAEIESIIEEANHSEGSFNVYAEVKQRLIEKGVPAEQVVFIHDYNSQKSKEALFKEVQQGNIRIVLGSTQKLGTGVNVQDRVVAVHHLDVPWTPASMEQRNGRALRQGNEVAKEHLNNELPVYAYATERTLDAYKYQLLQTKQRFLDQVKSGEVEDRVIRESDGDSESGVGYAELVAMLSGNTDILTKSKLETKVNDLKRKKRNFLSEVYEAKAKIDELETRNPQIEKRIKLTGQNIKELTNAIQYDENGKMAVNDIDGKKLTTVKDEKGKNRPAERTDYAKEAIKIVEEKLNRAKTGDEVDLFTINGIKISGRSNEASLIGTQSSSLFINANNGEKYSFSFSLIPGAFLNNIQKTIENIPNIQRAQEAIVEKNKRDLKAYQELLEKGTEWEKEVELTQAIEELKEVTKRLTPVEEKNTEQTSEEKQISDNTIRIGDLAFTIGKESFVTIAEAKNTKSGNSSVVVRINEQLNNADYAKKVKPLIEKHGGEWNTSNKVILFDNIVNAVNFSTAVEDAFPSLQDNYEAPEPQSSVTPSIKEEYSPEPEIKNEIPIAPQVQKEPTVAKLLPVEEFRHTKTGQILYNVKINGRSDEYSNMVSVAKRYNPYGKQKPYNTFSKGFLFEKKEDAENFKNEVNNTIFDSNSTVNEPQATYKSQEAENLQDRTLEDTSNGTTDDNLQRQGNTPEYSNNGGYKGVKGQVYQELKNLILTHKVKIFDSATFNTLFNKLNTKKVTHLTSSPYNTFGNPFNIAYQIYNQLEDYNGENFNDPKELGFDEEDSTPLFRKANNLPETITINGVERPTTNSKGQPIADSEEKIRNFWKWFSGSKVVDEEGRPLVVYHGTDKVFDKFEKGDIGFHFGTPYQANNREDITSIMPVYLKIENPIRTKDLDLWSGTDVVDALPKYFTKEEDSKLWENDYPEKDVRNILLEKGIDGFIYLNRAEMENSDDSQVGRDRIGLSDKQFQKKYKVEDSWIALSPTQIKSATGNIGTFDGNNPDIRFRKTSPIGFYSTVESALEQIKQEKGTTEQFKAMLLKNGAKQAEIDWMGWDEYFVGNRNDIDPNQTIVGVNIKGTITKAEIQNWIDQNKIEVEEVVKGDNGIFEIENKIDALNIKIRDINSDNTISYKKRAELTNPFEKERYNLKEERDRLKSLGSTKFSQYVEPGGENYKELLLTMPEKNIELKKLEQKYGDNWLTGATSEEIKKVQKENKGQGTFKSSHFDEPNILAHVRFNEREVNGERVLFIEEIQSDWAQKGKKEGFVSQNTIKSKKELFDYEIYLDNKYNDGWNEEEISTEDYEKLNKLKIAAGIKPNGTPSMPFSKTDQWVNLAFRRMMRYAAENGFDRIAWTNGEQQAARYDLSKSIDKVYYNPNTKEFGYFVKGEKTPEIKTKTEPTDIENYIGKDATKKLLDSPLADDMHEIEGDDLKVGGSGMKAFYDAIIPSAANKLGKPFGARVENIQIDVKPEMTDEGIDLESGEVGTAPEGKYAEVQSLPVTDKMIESVSQGVPLFRNEYDTPIEAAERVVKAMNQRAEMVKGIADRLSNELNTPIIVVRNETMLPLNLQRQVKKQGAKRSVMGVYNPTDGKIYLVSNNIPSELETEKTILHEIVGHKGLRSLLGAKAHRNLMEMVWNSLTPAQKADLKNRLGNLDPLVLADEYMAELAEQNSTPKWYEKVLAKLREMLRKVFPNLRINNTELKTIIRKSYEALKRPTPEQFDNPLDFAEALSKYVKNTNEPAALFRRAPQQKEENSDLDIENKSIDKKKQRIQDKIEQTPNESETHKKRTILKQKIKDLESGWKSGEVDTKAMIWKVQTDVIEYAKKNMPFDKAGKSEINSLLRLVRYANNPKHLETVLEKIDTIVSGLDVKLKLNNIDKILHDNIAKNVNGKPQGTLDPKVYLMLDKIRAIRKLKAEDEIDQYVDSLNDDDIEGTTLFSVFGNLEEKSRDEINDALDKLISIVSTGKVWYHDQLQKRKKINDGLRGMVLDKVSGGQGLVSELDLISSNSQVKTGAIGRFINAHINFEWLLDKISKDKSEETGKGKMQEYFGDVVTKATNDESKGIREQTDFIHKKAAEIFGLDGLKLAKKFHDNTKVIKKSGVTYINREGKRVEIPLSQNQAYKKWMEWQDQSLSKTFKTMGWDETTRKELDKFIFPDVKEWAEWQLKEYYPGYYEGINQKYNEAYFANLGRNENYSPIRREVVSPSNVEDAMMQNPNVLASVGNQSLKTRKSNINNLLLVDGDSMLAQHIAQMEHFKAWVMPINQLRSVFSSREVHKAIKNNHGVSVLSNLNNQIADMARGGEERANIIDFVDKVRRNFVTAELGANISLFPKQSVSLLAYLSEVPVKNYVTGMLDLALHLRKAIGIIKSNEMVTERFQKGWAPEIRAAMKQDTPGALSQSRNILGNLRNILLFPTKMGDYTAVLGGWVVYKYHYDNQITKGKNEQEAHDFALNQVDRSVSRTQQSGALKDVSQIQKGSWNKVLTMFKSSPIQQFRYENAAFRNLINGRGSVAQNAKIIALYHIVIPVMFQLISNLFTDDDDEKERNRLLRAGVLGSFNSLMVVGDIVESVLEKIMGESWGDYSATPLEGSVTKGLQGVGNISSGVKDLDKDKILKGVDQLIYGINNIGIGLPYRPVKKLIKQGDDILHPENVKLRKAEEEYKKIKKEVDDWTKARNKAKNEKDFATYRKLSHDDYMFKKYTSIYGMEDFVYGSEDKKRNLEKMYRQDKISEAEYIKKLTAIYESELKTK